MQNRLYKIQDGISFRTGNLPDGSQLLISRYGSKAVGIRFSEEGELMGCESYAIGPNVDIPDEQIDAVFERLGITPGIIRIRKFVLPEYGIEIRDIPGYLQEYIDALDSFDVEDAPQLEKAISEWNKRGSYVIIWCEEYEMDAEGAIEST